MISPCSVSIMNTVNANKSRDAPKDPISLLHLIRIYNYVHVSRPQHFINKVYNVSPHGCKSSKFRTCEQFQYFVPSTIPDSKFLHQTAFLSFQIDRFVFITHQFLLQKQLKTLHANSYRLYMQTHKKPFCSKSTLIHLHMPRNDLKDPQHSCDCRTV